MNSEFSNLNDTSECSLWILGDEMLRFRKNMNASNEKHTDEKPNEMSASSKVCAVWGHKQHELVCIVFGKWAPNESCMSSKEKLSK